MGGYIRAHPASEPVQEAEGGETLASKWTEYEAVILMRQAVGRGVEFQFE